jgi:NADPH-dependent curcumin reductase CurA
MRGWVAAAANYSEPVGIGEVMRAFATGTVIASRHPDFREGDAVTGLDQQIKIGTNNKLWRRYNRPTKSQC